MPNKNSQTHSHILRVEKNWRRSKKKEDEEEEEEKKEIATNQQNGQFV